MAASISFNFSRMICRATRPLPARPTTEINVLLSTARKILQTDHRERQFHGAILVFHRWPRHLASCSCLLSEGIPLASLVRNRRRAKLEVYENHGSRLDFWRTPHRDTRERPDVFDSLAKGILYIQHEDTEDFSVELYALLEPRRENDRLIRKRIIRMNIRVVYPYDWSGCPTPSKKTAHWRGNFTRTFTAKIWVKSILKQTFWLIAISVSTFGRILS